MIITWLTDLESYAVDVDDGRSSHYSRYSATAMGGRLYEDVAIVATVNTQLSWLATEVSVGAKPS